MEKLRLDNRQLIVSQIKQYATKNEIEYVEFLELIYDIIANEAEESDHLDNIVNTLKVKLKKETLFDTEEEMFHVISVELDDIYTNDVISNIDPKDMETIFTFLKENYLEMFNSFLEKKGYVNDSDYDDCVLSLLNNYDIETEIGDILVGKFIGDNIFYK